MAELLTLERRDDGVAVLTLANGKVNALSGALLRELRSAADELTADPPGAVVVTGGERIFAAGADISEFGGPDEAGPITAGFHDTLDAIAGIPRFVIAAVNGYALGGGCELALACDYRIAGPKAVFGQPEILLGIIPGGGGTQRLARLVGPSRAKELCLTGRQVKVDEAVRIGLADEAVDGDADRAGDRAGGRGRQGPLGRPGDHQAGRSTPDCPARWPTAWHSSARRSSRCSTPTTAAPAWPASSSTAPARRPSPATDPTTSPDRSRPTRPRRSGRGRRGWPDRRARARREPTRRGCRLRRW